MRSLLSSFVVSSSSLSSFVVVVVSLGTSIGGGGAAAPVGISIVRLVDDIVVGLFFNLYCFMPFLFFCSFIFVLFVVIFVLFYLLVSKSFLVAESMGRVSFVQCFSGSSSVVYSFV